MGKELTEGTVPDLPSAPPDLESSPKVNVIPMVVAVKEVLLPPHAIGMPHTEQTVNDVEAVRLAQPEKLKYKALLKLVWQLIEEKLPDYKGAVTDKSIQRAISKFIQANDRFLDFQNEEDVRQLLKIIQDNVDGKAKKDKQLVIKVIEETPEQRFHRQFNKLKRAFPADLKKTLSAIRYHVFIKTKKLPKTAQVTTALNIMDAVLTEEDINGMSETKLKKLFLDTVKDIMRHNKNAHGQSNTEEFGNKQKDTKLMNDILVLVREALPDISSFATLDEVRIALSTFSKTYERPYNHNSKKDRTTITSLLEILIKQKKEEVEITADTMKSTEDIFTSAKKTLVLLGYSETRVDVIDRIVGAIKKFIMLNPATPFDPSDIFHKKFVREALMGDAK